MKQYTILLLVVTLSALPCSVSPLGPPPALAEIEEFSPFKQLFPITSDEGKELKGSKNVCCLADPFNPDSFWNHKKNEEVPTTKGIKKFFKKQISKKKKTRTSKRVAVVRAKKNKIKKRLKKFGQQANKCINGLFPFDNDSLFPCDSFAALFGGQAKLTPEGVLTIVFEDEVSAPPGGLVNILSGSKDDLTKQTLVQLATSAFTFPTSILMWELTTEQCQALNTARDFNLAVPQSPIDNTKTGDFTELGNECEVTC